LHGSAAVQQAIAETVARLDESLPRLGAADAVDPEPALVLERLERRTRRASELPCRIADRAVAEREQPVLDVGDRVADVPFAQGQRGITPGCTRCSRCYR
jgi:hypothetical protein